MKKIYQRPALNARSHLGFTLIEVMITVAIIAILAAVALPAYKQQIIRGNRGAAQATMMEIASREQQYFLANRAYTSALTGSNSLNYTMPSEISSLYTASIALGTGNVPYFKITFEAIGTQESDGDLTLDSAGVKEPSSKW